MINIELLNYALMILSKRAGDARFSRKEQAAYCKAFFIVSAALENDEEALKEYDLLRR